MTKSLREYFGRDRGGRDEGAPMHLQGAHRRGDDYSAVTTAGAIITNRSLLLDYRAFADVVEHFFGAPLADARNGWQARVERMLAAADARAERGEARRRHGGDAEAAR